MDRNTSSGPPGHGSLDALLSEFEPLPDDALAVEATTNATERVASTEHLIPFSSLPSTPKSDENMKPTDMVGIRRARYRARSRNELHYLREVVTELQVELERWKARANGDPQTVAEPSAQATLWKAIAARQKLERHEAESENVRLRVLLDNQIRFAAQLQHLLRQREGRYGPPSVPRVFRVNIDAFDAEVLERYLSEMDGVYAQTHDVMCETGVDFRPETPHRLIRMRNVCSDSDSVSSSNAEGALCAEFLDVNLINTDFATARASVWRTITQHYLERSGSVYKPLHEHPDVLTIKYRYAAKWFGRESHITVTHSLKMYNEPNRQVNVYRVLSVGEGALSGMATDETGWCVLTPSDTDANVTVSRSVTRLSAMRFHKLASQSPQNAPPQLLEFAKILFEFGDQDFAKMVSHFQRKYQLRVLEMKARSGVSSDDKASELQG